MSAVLNNLNSYIIKCKVKRKKAKIILLLISKIKVFANKFYII